MLLNSGADINISNKFGDTPLLYSIKNSDDKISIYLVKFGADTTVKNINGDTVNSLCIKYGKRVVQQYIMSLKK